MSSTSLRLRPLALLAATLLVPATGCAVEDAGFIDDDAEIESRDDWGCVTCGVNDAIVNDEPIRDLDRGGLPNEGGVTLEKIQDPDGVSYTLGTYEDEIVALSSTHTIVAQASALIGWQLQLDTPNGPETVKITSYVRDISSWKANGAPMSAYGLAYLLDDGDSKTWRNVCPDYAESPDEATVTILAGETYDSDLKLVNPNTGTWITLACRDQAAYKMKRLSYGPHGDLLSAVPRAGATADQRQSTLKMLTADYCGTGTSFTVTGTPLYWRNHAGTVVFEPLLVKLTAVEALWDADGAICLTTPRRATLDDVAAECELPVCTQAMVDAGNWEWVTRVDL